MIRKKNVWLMLFVMIALVATFLGFFLKGTLPIKNSAAFSDLYPVYGTRG